MKVKPQLLTTKDDCAYKDAVKVLERANNRLSIIVIILISLLVISNVMWFQYEQSFADETWTYETAESPSSYYTEAGYFEEMEAEE